ncbi:hypothetical protein LSH36_3g09021 [Paralvinella palmiformis]|uniref:Uncharacterized protein n=1 Tax=Paralvinella palmiformis TaxID=53620 RepID=A0AAD9KGT1_9ANNE|nr:hypothetical protein LSH36_3g09021 [Paralvinella palmiformis]
MASDADGAAKKILFLSRLQVGSGNKSTLDRIRGYFEESGYECVSVHTDEVKCFDDIRQCDVKCRFNAAIGLHAYHAGRWLRDLGCPYILMFGGTDLNECSTDVVKLKVMTEAVERARFLVTFGENMVQQVDSLWPGLSKDSRLKVIPQGISVGIVGEMASIHEQYGIPGDCKMLTMVGAIRPVKDQLYLLDTFNAWRQQTKTPVYLTIIGPVVCDFI